MFFSHAYKLFSVYAFQYLNPDYFHWSYCSAGKRCCSAASSSHPRGKGRTCSYLLKMTLLSQNTEQNLMIRKVHITQATENSSVLRILKEVYFYNKDMWNVFWNIHMYIWIHPWGLDVQQTDYKIWLATLLLSLLTAVKAISFDISDIIPSSLQGVWSDTQQTSKG